MSDFQGVKPSGWPEHVDAPGVHGGPWENSAQKWLFEAVPGEWRTVGILRRYPLILARDACYLVEGQLQALREAYRKARVELAPQIEPQQIEEQLKMYQLEAARLEQLRRQVQLVYDALAGVRWIPRRNDTDWSKL